ncbi:MAG: hypothetical protein WCC63_03565 [Candidatus Bathyarchaeia archaeon]
MIKALAYVTIALVLGVAMTLLPTWLFLAKTDQPYASYAARLSSGRIPLLDQEGDSHGEPIMPQWLGIAGASFVVASVVYILFKRETLDPFARDSPR